MPEMPVDDDWGAGSENGLRIWKKIKENLKKREKLCPIWQETKNVSLKIILLMNYRECVVLHLYLDVSQMDLLIAHSYTKTPISWVIFWHFESLNNLIKPKKRAESRKHAYPHWVCNVLCLHRRGIFLLSPWPSVWPLGPYFSHSVVRSLTELDYVVCSEALLWVGNRRCTSRARRGTVQHWLEFFQVWQKSFAQVLTVPSAITGELQNWWCWATEALLFIYLLYVGFPLPFIHLPHSVFKADGFNTVSNNSREHLHASSHGPFPLCPP